MSIAILLIIGIIIGILLYLKNVNETNSNNKIIPIEENSKEEIEEVPVVLKKCPSDFEFPKENDSNVTIDVDSHAFLASNNVDLNKEHVKTKFENNGISFEVECESFEEYDEHKYAQCGSINLNIAGNQFNNITYDSLGCGIGGRIMVVDGYAIYEIENWCCPSCNHVYVYKNNELKFSRDEIAGYYSDNSNEGINYGVKYKDGKLYFLEKGKFYYVDLSEEKLTAKHICDYE